MHVKWGKVAGLAAVVGVAAAGGGLGACLRAGDTLAFAEVKTRRGGRFGAPAEAVVPATVTRLARLAARWLAQSALRPREVRFDVVSVLARPAGPATVEHLRDAF